MEKTKLQTQQDKHVSKGRRARLIMGWVFIVFAVWLLGNSVYLLVTGRMTENPQLPIAATFLFIGGGTLLRSKPDDRLKPLN